eukprot:2305628-Prorocentrum_lima.AAC.1
MTSSLVGSEMCIRDSLSCMFHATRTQTISVETRFSRSRAHSASAAGNPPTCLLYTSDAADDM